MQLAPFTVEINGNHVKVTEGLGAALGALAEAHESPWIWIDALCINQVDLEERNAQVSVMGRIYAGAYGVLAWLGPINDSSDRLFDRLQRRCRKCSDRLLHSVDPWNRSLNRGELRSEATGHNPEPSLFSMLVDLAHKPYWRRAWIRQELHFARRVTLLCGDRVAPATHLAELYQTVGESAWQNDDIKYLIQLVGSATNFTSYKADLPLWKLLETCPRQRLKLRHWWC